MIRIRAKSTGDVWQHSEAFRWSGCEWRDQVPAGTRGCAFPKIRRSRPASAGKAESEECVLYESRLWYVKTWHFLFRKCHTFIIPCCAWLPLVAVCKILRFLPFCDRIEHSHRRERNGTNMKEVNLTEGSIFQKLIRFSMPLLWKWVGCDRRKGTW